MSKLNTRPSNTELFKAIDKLTYKHDWTLEEKADVVKLFQAREQKILTELLGELPEKKRSKEINNYYFNERFNNGYNKALSQVVSVIKSKIGELNG